MSGMTVAPYSPLLLPGVRFFFSLPFLSRKPRRRTASFKRVSCPSSTFLPLFPAAVLFFPSRPGKSRRSQTAEELITPSYPFPFPRPFLSFLFSAAIIKRPITRRGQYVSPFPLQTPFRQAKSTTENGGCNLPSVYPHSLCLHVSFLSFLKRNERRERSPFLSLYSRFFLFFPPFPIGPMVRKTEAEGRAIRRAPAHALSLGLSFPPLVGRPFLFLFFSIV